MATITTSQVLTGLIETPISKDPNQWYAGGTLRNETYPGGINYSPTNIPSFNNTLQGSSVATSLLNGNFQYLNAGLIAISNFMNSGVLQLLEKYSERETTVIKIKIEVYQSTSIGEDNYVGEGSFDVEGTIDYSNGNFSLDSLTNINKNSLSLANIASGDSLTIATSLYNVATNDELSFTDKIAAGVVGTVKSQATSIISNRVMSAMGADYTWSMTKLQVTGTIVGLVVGQIVGELFEYAVGLDNSIGYGGEINRTASMILGTPAYSQEKGFMGISGIGSDISYALGFSDFKSNDLTSRGGTYLGSTESLTLSSGTEIDQMFSIETGDTTITGGDWYDEIAEDINIGSVAAQAAADAKAMEDLMNGGNGNQASDGFEGLSNEKIDDVNDADFGIDAQDNYDGNNDSNDGGGTYCCTAMVSNRRWKLKKLKKMEQWHKSQPKWWREGYDVWGKFVAKNILRDGSGIWGKMMNAFYDRKVKGSKFTIYTFSAYAIIYSGVITYSLYKKLCIIKNKYLRYNSRKGRI